MSTWTFEEWATSMMAKEQDRHDEKIRNSKVADKTAVELFWREEQLFQMWKIAFRVARRADWLAKNYKIDLDCLFGEREVIP